MSATSRDSSAPGLLAPEQEQAPQEELVIGMQNNSSSNIIADRPASASQPADEQTLKNRKHHLLHPFALHQWYEHFKPFTFETEFVQLTKRQCHEIFRGVSRATSSSASCGERIKICFAVDRQGGQGGSSTTRGYRCNSFNSGFSSDSGGWDDHLDDEEDDGGDNSTHNLGTSSGEDHDVEGGTSDTTLSDAGTEAPPEANEDHAETSSSDCATAKEEDEDEQRSPVDTSTVSCCAQELLEVVNEEVISTTSPAGTREVEDKDQADRVARLSTTQKEPFIADDVSSSSSTANPSTGNNAAASSTGKVLASAPSAATIPCESNMWPQEEDEHEVKQEQHDGEPQLFEFGQHKIVQEMKQNQRVWVAGEDAGTTTSCTLEHDLKSNDYVSELSLCKDFSSCNNIITTTGGDFFEEVVESILTAGNAGLGISNEATSSSCGGRVKHTTLHESETRTTDVEVVTEISSSTSCTAPPVREVLQSDEEYKIDSTTDTRPVEEGKAEVAEHDQAARLSCQGQDEPDDVALAARNLPGAEGRKKHRRTIKFKERYPELHAELRQKIDRLHGSVFPKLHYTAPQDAKWMAWGKTLECHEPEEVFSLLVASDVVEFDLAEVLDNKDEEEEEKHNCSSTHGLNEENDEDEMMQGQNGGPQHRAALHLALRRFHADFNPALEFRCFVGIFGPKNEDFQRRREGQTDTEPPAGACSGDEAARTSASTIAQSKITCELIAITQRHLDAVHEFLVERKSRNSNNAQEKIRERIERFFHDGKMNSTAGTSRMKKTSTFLDKLGEYFLVQKNLATRRSSSDSPQRQAEAIDAKVNNVQAASEVELHQLIAVDVYLQLQPEKSTQFEDADCFLVDLAPVDVAARAPDSAMEKNINGSEGTTEDAVVETDTGLFTREELVELLSARAKTEVASTTPGGSTSSTCEEDEDVVSTSDVAAAGPAPKMNRSSTMLTTTSKNLFRVCQTAADLRPDKNRYNAMPIELLEFMHNPEDMMSAIQKIERQLNSSSSST
ncbi:unnamed protein product [Amoebophrya sp. A120]|nr:unnamed protein product [Amoebophrya sp. A120]|eukprot:GSA120T00007262001.1